MTYGLVWSENDSADDNTTAQLLQLHFHRIAPLHCTNYELLRFGARLSRLMIAGARLHSINLQLTQTGERGQTVHRRTTCTIAYRHEFDCCNGHNSDVTLSVHNASHQAALKMVKCVSLGLVPKRSLIGSLF